MHSTSLPSTRYSQFAALISTTALCVASLALTGCGRTEDASSGQGPAEVAGKQLDKAAIEAGRGLKQAAEETGKVIEKAGAKLQEKAQEAQK